MEVIDAVRLPLWPVEVEGERCLEATGAPGTMAKLTSSVASSLETLSSDAAYVAMVTVSTHEPTWHL